ncbi:hypothetical protein TRFO_28617 [Tritrichomonas foetus]|uniref:Thioredoxin domain-containing protein n=1 Tax=Tritrichomonas foetus TaxID=1144522 RepID=A0A1J4K2J1_9EUKA|nr:hypothetical protein TRFO_28617 [Tritrichomonas foetus]|eukprot:OHT03964.1 hypothetical protein TRFO_28617 [Tritrichomonas foetus]
MFLFSLLSIFIPYEATHYPIIFPFNESEFQSFCVRSGTVVTLVLPDSKTRETENAIALFTEAIPEFSEKSQFAIVTQSQIPNLASSFHYPGIYMILLNKARISLSCPFPTDELALATTLYFWTTSPHAASTTVKELYSSLGPTKYAFILRDEQINEGFNPLMQFISLYGSTEMVIATNKVFEELQMEKFKFLLFRRDDSSIVPIENLTDFEYFKKLGKPDFGVITEDDLVSKNLTFIGLLANVLDLKAMDTLHDIAPEYKAVHITGNFIRAVEATMRRSIEYLPDVIVFNYESGFYYPNNNSFSGLYLNSEKWLNSVKNYINQIRNNEIKPEFFSEPLPEYNESEALHRIVGSNFAEFVDDPNNDVLVFFKSEDQSNYIEMFKQVADDVLGNGTENIKFGFIDPYENSSPRFFPLLIQMPHAELYLRGNKFDSEPLFGEMSRDSILRFLNMNTKINLEFNKLTKEEALREMDSIMSQFQQMPSYLQKKAINYIKQVLTPITEIDPFTITYDPKAEQNNHTPQ